MLPASLCAPPFSPVLIAGFFIRPLPLAPLNRILSLALKKMHRKHQAVFDRIAAIPSPNYLINPVDLPFSFHLNANASHPTLKAVSADTEVQVAATISGPLAALLSLLEGRIDGDALFFSRTLTISGDTEAVVALRNAVDGSQINLLSEAMEFAGPFKGIGTQVFRTLSRVWQRSEVDMALVAQSLTTKQFKSINAHQEKIEALEQQVRKLTAHHTRKQTLKTG